MHDHNSAWVKSNLKHEANYRGNPKESDKKILELLSGLSGDLLDIGCSTGNLLHHIANRYSQFRLFGGDIGPTRIEQCRQDPQLNGMTFEVMDILELPRGRWDVVVANATLCLIPQNKFEQAVRSLHGALKPGGTLITLDWYHPHTQDVFITEVTDQWPNGFVLNFRSYRMAEGVFRKAGFKDVRFHPFFIPIDLPDNKDLITHTVQTEAGRLQFRGVICQPWCHLTAKSS